MLKSIVLGIIQGIGEFLPISSSAHLILVPYLLGWPESSMAFDVALHFGTLLAVLVVFFKDWWNLFIGMINKLFKNQVQNWEKLLPIKKICLYGNSFTLFYIGDEEYE